VLAMVHKLLHQRGVAAALLARPDEGERALTNVLHLAALLQEASGSLQGETALLRYLGEQIGADDSSDSGAAQLRLETDAALVKVITLHKSKGLQYPVVFLPFSYTSAIPRTESGEDKTDPKVKKRIEEEKAESVRLMYVALTRAERALFMSAATPSWLPDRTSLYTLLNRKSKTDLARKLAAWDECDHIRVEPLPEANKQPWSGSSTPAVQQAALKPLRSHHSAWRSSSFSSMTRDLHQLSSLPLTAQDEFAGGPPDRCRR
jgi:exodeoxyribonuclease V beta subunit